MAERCAGRTYAMADIHNDADSFISLLKKIGFSAQDRLYILGDIFDRGEKPLELYFEILKYENIFLTRGNHDTWLAYYIIDWFQSGKEPVRPYYYNTFEILRRRMAELDIYQMAEWILDFPLQLEITVEGKPFLLAHAATSIERHPDSYYLMGEVEFFRSNPAKARGYVSVVGHNPVEHLRHELHMPPGENENRWSVLFLDELGIIVIDSGNGYRDDGGKLACLCLNDYRCYYV